MKLEKIKELITKLLALSKDKSTTLEEASLAAEKAQKLLWDYNLSLEDVDLEEKTKLHENDPIEDSHGLFAIPLWKISLSATIAEVNFCKSLVCGISSFNEQFIDKYTRDFRKMMGEKELFLGTINIVGKKKNVQSVKYLYNSICNQVQSLADIEYDLFIEKNRKARTSRTYHNIFGKFKFEPGVVTLSNMFDEDAEVVDQKNWKDSFIFGLYNAIRKRLIDSFNKMKNAAGEQALVRVSKDLKEAEDFINAMNLNKIDTNENNLNRHAFKNGYDSANKINIDQNKTELGMGLKQLKSGL